MSGFDAKRFKVANPEALGEKEKQLWVRLEPIVQDLLDELKDAGKIESVFPPAKMALLQATFNKLDEFSAVHNVVLHLSESEPKFKEFLATNSKFGFTESNTISAYVMATVTVSVLSTELFKLLLLFLTKDVDPRVANFGRTMAREAPKPGSPWSHLSTRRLATPWLTEPAIVNKKLRLFENAKLATLETDGKMDEMELSDYMMRIKDQNVLYQVLVNVLNEEARKGFFATAQNWLGDSSPSKFARMNSSRSFAMEAASPSNVPFKATRRSSLPGLSALNFPRKVSAPPFFSDEKYASLYRLSIPAR